MTHDPTCLFCRIVAGDIPANVIWQDDHTLVFADVHPQAPTHWLVIPKHHVENLAAVDHLEMFDQVGHAIQAVTAVHNLTDYRTVTNNGAGAGQSVFHWHTHILAGRPLLWPPG